MRVYLADINRRCRCRPSCARRSSRRCARPGWTSPTSPCRSVMRAGRARSRSASQCASTSALNADPDAVLERARRGRAPLPRGARRTRRPRSRSRTWAIPRSSSRCRSALAEGATARRLETALRVAAVKALARARDRSCRSASARGLQRVGRPAQRAVRRREGGRTRAAGGRARAARGGEEGLTLGGASPQR